MILLAVLAVLLLSAAVVFVLFWFGPSIFEKISVMLQRVQSLDSQVRLKNLLSDKADIGPLIFARLEDGRKREGVVWFFRIRICKLWCRKTEDDMVGDYNIRKHGSASCPIDLKYVKCRERLGWWAVNAGRLVKHVAFPAWLAALAAIASLLLLVLQLRQ